MNDPEGYAIHYIHQWCMRLGVAMPTVKFRKMKYYGSCDFTDHVITINKHILHNRFDLEDTCIHEIIHLWIAVHNFHFFEQAQKLGLYRNWTYEQFKNHCK